MRPVGRGDQGKPAQIGESKLLWWHFGDNRLMDRGRRRASVSLAVVGTATRLFSHA